MHSLILCPAIPSLLLLLPLQLVWSQAGYAYPCYKHLCFVLWTCHISLPAHFSPAAAQQTRCKKLNHGWLCWRVPCLLGFIFKSWTCALLGRAGFGLQLALPSSGNPSSSPLWSGLLLTTASALKEHPKPLGASREMTSDLSGLAHGIWWAKIPFIKADRWHFFAIFTIQSVLIKVLEIRMLMCDNYSFPSVCTRREHAILFPFVYPVSVESIST